MPIFKKAPRVERVTAFRVAEGRLHETEEDARKDALTAHLTQVVQGFPGSRLNMIAMSMAARGSRPGEIDWLVSVGSAREALAYAAAELIAGHLDDINDIMKAA